MRRTDFCLCSFHIGAAPLERAGRCALLTLSTCLFVVPVHHRHHRHHLVGPKQAAQDAQGEAHGDPIILEGGDSANADGIPHSGMLEQVSTPDPTRPRN